MGVNLREIISAKEVGIEDLKGKRIVVDAYNHLYQYLSTIRSRDGTLLMDSKGRITSHLTGLFSRTANLMSNGLKLAYVFDGVPPKLKEETWERRKQAKVEAEKRYEIAREKEDVAEMRKYAARTSRLTSEMVDESKKLLSAMGIPVVQAPSEGDAQAAFMVRTGDFYAVASQDYDTLVHAATRLVRNLSVAGRKKKANVLAYEKINPEMINLQELLKELKITQDKLIALAVMVGTDYNFGGIKGIGPKKALKLLQENSIESAFEKAQCDFDWKEIFNTFKNMKTTGNYSLEWKKPDRKEIIQLLVDEHDFSLERVEKTINTIAQTQEKQEQKTLQF